MDLVLLKKLRKGFSTKVINKEPDKPPALSHEEKLAIEEVEIARSNFNDADEDTIDLAIYELMVAEERLNLLIKNKKKK